MASTRKAFKGGNARSVGLSRILDNPGEVLVMSVLVSSPVRPWCIGPFSLGGHSGSKPPRSDFE